MSEEDTGQAGQDQPGAPGEYGGGDVPSEGVPGTAQDVPSAVGDTSEDLEGTRPSGLPDEAALQPQEQPGGGAGGPSWAGEAQAPVQAAAAASTQPRADDPGNGPGDPGGGYATGGPVTGQEDQDQAGPGTEQ